MSTTATTRTAVAVALAFALVVWSVAPAAAASAEEPREAERMTPVLQSVLVPPVPFDGSDGAAHLVYELWLTNFSSGETTIESVEVLGDGKVVQTLDGDALASRLRPDGAHTYGATLAASVQAMLFLHVTLPPGTPAVKALEHRVTANVSAAPPAMRTITSTGGKVTVDRQDVVIVSPPLRGSRFISADSCCDAVRHTRAALPVNGHVRLAQRFAVDWEQLDAQGRIYDGPQQDPKSYTIFGAEALAVADATVASVRDGLHEQTPGTYPTNIAIADADGNSVILDLGGGRHALYAHLQPGSLKVRAGDRVTRGQVLGLVGNSGNSVAPHLHFHVMDGPSPLDSNGLPYLLDSFLVVGRSPGTEAFDAAEAKGTPLAVEPVAPPQRVENALPLDQLIIDFPR